MESLKMTVKELKTGVELEREQNNDYSQLEMFTTVNQKEFFERCELDGSEHLFWDIEFFPDFDKAFVKKHPHTGLVKYKMLKRKMISFSVIITMGKSDVYDTLSLAGIEQDNIKDRNELSKSMDIYKVLEHCNWESYFAWNDRNKRIKLNDKDRKFIYDCIVNGWTCFEKKTRGFLGLKDAMDITYGTLD